MRKVARSGGDGGGGGGRQCVPQEEPRGGERNGVTGEGSVWEGWGRVVYQEEPVGTLRWA